MASGLSNVPTTFQRGLYIILPKGKWQTALVYIENMVIYTWSIEEQFGEIRTVLEILKNAEDALLETLVSLDRKLVHLGTSISPDRIQEADWNIQDVRHVRILRFREIHAHSSGYLMCTVSLSSDLQRLRPHEPKFARRTDKEV